MSEHLFEHTNWGKLLLDAQATVRNLNIVPPDRVRITRRLPALQKQIATPCVIIKPLEKRPAEGTNNPIRLVYGIVIAYVRAAPAGAAVDSLPEELTENERFWATFHLTREWATSLGGAMFLSEIEGNTLLLEEAEQHSFAVQYFNVLCRVDEVR